MGRSAAVAAAGAAARAGVAEATTAGGDRTVRFAGDRGQAGLARADATGGVQTTATARGRARPTSALVLVGRRRRRRLRGQAAAVAQHLRHEEAHHHRADERGTRRRVLLHALFRLVVLLAGFLAGVLRRRIGGLLLRFGEGVAARGRIAGGLGAGLHRGIQAFLHLHLRLLLAGGEQQRRGAHQQQRGGAGTFHGLMPCRRINAPMMPNPGQQPESAKSER
ncbi:hypothetical protein G6F22_018510 [Rhizopus arrhizus]|nr:hypothetical protein G6F22_018510 [Rhizopus arrhizus]